MNCAAPTEEILNELLAEMAREYLREYPVPHGFTRLWRVRPSPEKPLDETLIDGDPRARERWYALYPSMLGPYAYKRWPHGELVAITVQTELVEAFRVSAQHIGHEDGLNPLAFSGNPENEFFFPRIIARRVEYVGCVWEHHQTLCAAPAAHSKRQPTCCPSLKPSFSPLSTDPFSTGLF